MAFLKMMTVEQSQRLQELRKLSTNASDFTGDQHRLSRKHDYSKSDCTFYCASGVEDPKALMAERVELEDLWEAHLGLFPAGHHGQKAPKPDQTYTLELDTTVGQAGNTYGGRFYWWGGKDSRQLCGDNFAHGLRGFSTPEEAIEANRNWIAVAYPECAERIPAAKRPPGRPPGKYKAGDGAPRKTVRIDDLDKRAFVEAYPGGLAAIVDEAFRRSKN